MTINELVESGIIPFLLLGFSASYILIGVKLGWIETPAMTRKRKRKETLDANRKKEEFDTLSPDGKLLHNLTEKQTQTEANTSAIYRMILGGAIGYLIFSYWPF